MDWLIILPHDLEPDAGTPALVRARDDLDWEDALECVYLRTEGNEAIVVDIGAAPPYQYVECDGEDHPRRVRPIDVRIDHVLAALAKAGAGEGSLDIDEALRKMFGVGDGA